jgi:predicted Fe-Mo cluster-binding NifX family protein
MIIAVALNEDNPQALIAEQFGRCAWYCIYDSANGKINYIENPNRQADQGAGFTSAEMLMKLSIQLVVAGRFGSKVVEFFRKNNVQMVIPENEQKLEVLINMINN